MFNIQWKTLLEALLMKPCDAVEFDAIGVIDKGESETETKNFFKSRKKFFPTTLFTIDSDFG